MKVGKKEYTNATLKITLMIELAEIFDEHMAVLGVWLSKSQKSIFAICIYRTR